MPRGDGTGPWGTGSMTGRGAGFCAGYGMPGYANPIPGRGFGWWGRGGGGGRGRGFWGRGGGRGRRHMYWATGMPGWARFGPFVGPGAVAPPYPAYGGGMSKAEEVEVLRQQAEYFKANLEDITKRLETLESSDE